MSGTIRFDDEHIVKFTLNAEDQTITLEITDPVDTYVVEDYAYAEGES